MVLEELKTTMSTSIKGLVSTDYGAVTIGGVAGAWGSTILAEMVNGYFGLAGWKKILASFFTKVLVGGGFSWYLARRTTGLMRLGFYGAAIGAGISFGIDVIQHLMGGKTAEQQGFALAMRLRQGKTIASAPARSHFVYRGGHAKASSSTLREL